MLRFKQFLLTEDNNFKEFINHGWRNRGSGSRPHDSRTIEILGDDSIEYIHSRIDANPYDLEYNDVIDRWLENIKKDPEKYDKTAKYNPITVDTRLSDGPVELVHREKLDNILRPGPGSEGVRGISGVEVKNVEMDPKVKADINVRSALRPAPRNPTQEQAKINKAANEFMFDFGELEKFRESVLGLDRKSDEYAQRLIAFILGGKKPAEETDARFKHPFDPETWKNNQPDGSQVSEKITQLSDPAPAITPTTTETPVRPSTPSKVATTLLDPVSAATSAITTQASKVAPKFSVKPISTSSLASGAGYLGAGTVGGLIGSMIVEPTAEKLGVFDAVEKGSKKAFSKMPDWAVKASDTALGAAQVALDPIGSAFSAAADIRSKNEDRMRKAGMTEDEIAYAMSGAIQ
jgi:hypothetical protein